jgi:hypothetical protein
MYNQAQSAIRRDAKISAALNGAAPIWLIHDEWRAAEECFMFDLIYRHSIYGWIEQRFKYDAFNDVLYHFGQRALSEAEALSTQESEPYLPGEVSVVVPNNPRPR